MGLDAEIFFRCKTAELPTDDNLLPGFEIIPLDEYFSDFDYSSEAKFVVIHGFRYYEKGYERGNWPEIASVIMQLLACPDVEKVWYGHIDEAMKEIDADRLCEISRHYMANGHRPYLKG